MLELRIKQGRRHVPVFDLPVYVGRAEAAREVGDAIDGLIAFLDDLGGDPDLEDALDAEDDFTLTADAIEVATRNPQADCTDQDAGAYIEWHTLRGSHKARTHLLAGHEDDEEDDPSGQSDEDGVNTGDAPRFGWGGPSGAGCPISDPGGCQHDDREPEEWVC